MQAPVDYPIDDPAREARFSMDELTYAIWLDKHAAHPCYAEASVMPPPAFGTEDQTLTEAAHISQASSAVLHNRSLIPGNSGDYTDITAMFSRWSRALR